MCHNFEEWCKIWRRVDSRFQKWHEELGVMTRKVDAIFKEKRTGDLKNDIRNLVTFHESSRKSESLDFDRLLLSISYKVLAKEVQKIYLSWYWRAIQTLKRNWLFVWKMSWGIGWILTQAVMSKLCNVWTKQVRRSCAVKNDFNNGFKNNIRYLLNFHTNSWK